MKLWNHIKDRMLSYPDQVICENNARLSFEDTVIWSELFAKNLNGIKCCAILCQSEMVAAMALLACIASDVTAVPLSMRYGTLHCNKILDAISPDAIIMDKGSEINVFKISDSQYVVPQAHPAFIMSTSGTLGKTKGVMLSERNILTNIADISSYLKPDRQDRILISRPLYHSAVLTGEFLTALCNGVNIQFCSEPFQPQKLLSLLSEHQITMFGGTPTMLRLMARFKRTPLPDLKKISISGECMNAEVGKQIEAAFPNTSIFHVYGLTEASPRVSYLPPEKFHQYPNSVGIPLNFVTVKLVKSDGNEAKENEEGILWIKGENVMLGYYRDPEQTDRVLKDGWLCTGDIAERNEEGFLHIKGRVDDLIIRAGMNIYPQEIEDELKKDPRVKDVLVYATQHPHAGTQLAMKISGNFCGMDDIMALCKRTLPGYQVPSTVELVDELPKTASGKMIRKV